MNVKTKSHKQMLQTDAVDSTNEKALINNPTKIPAALLPHKYIQAATRDNTRKAYQADIRQFMNWGGVLPCEPTMIVRYLHEHAIKLNHRTLTRRLTAIRQWHRYQNFSDPTNHPLVIKTLTGIKNTHGQPKQKAEVLRIEDLKTIVATFKDSPHLMDIRNLALLQVGYFGAFRRSELVNIQWEHLTFFKARGRNSHS